MFSAILSLFAVLFSHVFVVLFIFIPILLICVISFILPAIALYNHAQTAGYDKPWLAFIPVAQTYLEYVLPRRRFKVIFFDTHDRKQMAWIAILVSTFGASVIAGLNVIPAFGQILDLALMLFLVAMNWRKMYDYLCTFTDDNSAMTFSIIGVFLPLVYAIYLFTIMKNKPEYGEGNYYNVIIPEEPEVKETATEASASAAPAAQTPVTETPTDNVQ